MLICNLVVFWKYLSKVQKSSEKKKKNTKYNLLHILVKQDLFPPSPQAQRWGRTLKYWQELLKEDMMSAGLETVDVADRNLWRTKINTMWLFQP